MTLPLRKYGGRAVESQLALIAATMGRPVRLVRQTISPDRFSMANIVTEKMKLTPATVVRVASVPLAP